MTIQEFRGDLFTSMDNLCHCVSSDMHMGKGIATVFKRKWGVPTHKYDNGTIYRAYGWQIGDVGIIQDQAVGGDTTPRYILYLVTKSRYWEKPTYDAIRKCLGKISSLDSISMPKIGCGLDRLEWGSVSTIIEDMMPDTDVRVYTL